MERRLGARARVDFPTIALVDGFPHECRAIDISASGMLLARPKGLSERPAPGLAALEIRVGCGAPIRARGRTVWSRGRLHALRFVGMNDADRLTLAEQVDRA